MPLIKNIVLSSKNIIILSYEKGFFHLLSANGLSRFFDFGSHLILAWIFVPEDLGRIKTMQSFLAILFVFASLGLDVSTLKICSEKRSVEEKRSYFNFALILTLASAVFTFIVFAIISWLGVFSVDRIINQYLWVIAFSIIPNTIVQVYLSFFQAQRKLKEYSYIQVAARIVAIIVVMVLSFLFLLKGYVWAIIFSSFLTLSSIFYFDTKTFGWPLRRIENINILFTNHSKYAPYSYLANIAGILGANIDILIMGFLNIDYRIIGYYAFAKIFIGLLRIAAQTVQQTTNPYFSMLANNVPLLIERYKKFNRIFQFGSLLITIIIGIILPLFFKYFDSGKYENSTVFFLLLLAAWFIRSNAFINSSVLFGIGQINYNFYISLIGLCATIGSMLLFHYLYEAIGIALGAIVGNIILFIVSQFVTNYKLRY